MWRGGRPREAVVVLSSRSVKRKNRAGKAVCSGKSNNLVTFKCFSHSLCRIRFCRSANHETQNYLLMRSVTLLLIAIASSIGWFPYTELRAGTDYKDKSSKIALTSRPHIDSRDTAAKIAVWFPHETTGPGDDNHLVAAQFTIWF
jgi:hypothetical protein